jgi:phosphoglycolate phosphatase
MEGKKIELVLFDLDGTLLTLNFNSEQTRKELHRFYHRAFGLDIHFKPVLQRISKAEKIIEGRSGRKKALEATARANNILISGEKAALDGSVLLPHSKSVLKTLRGNRIKTGVFSRTARNVVKAALKKHGLMGFDVVVAREDTSKTKPNPEPVLLALDKLKIHPEKCLVVGDHPFDIRSGKMAHARTAGVLTGYAPKKDLKDAGADYIFKDLKELVFALSHGDIS